VAANSSVLDANQLAKVPVLMAQDARRNPFGSLLRGLQRSVETAASQLAIHSPKRFDLLLGLLAIMVVMPCSIALAAAGPTLEADCGTGATIVGADSAGKVTLGEGVTTCTIDFSTQWPNAPACTAVNETNGGGNPQSVGTKTTTATVVLGGYYPWVAHDVISYICMGY
jgi:hypothetical protein